MTGVVLGVLALVLAGPAPALLARATWTHDVPRASVVLWQALALAAVLAATGAGLAVALSAWTGSDESGGARVAYAGVLTLTLVVLGRLAWSAVRVARDTRTRRRRHRALLDLLATADGLVPGVRVLAAETPVAYCLPGVRGQRVVLSAGALATLDRDETTAVLTHERAHLRARHDLVLEAFSVLRAAFPRFVRSDTVLEQNQVLVELLADDVARRRVGAAPLGRALVALAGGTVPVGGLGAGGSTTVLRVRRLARPVDQRPWLAAATYAAALALVAVPTLTVAVPWLAELARTL